MAAAQLRLLIVAIGLTMFSSHQCEGSGIAPVSPVTLENKQVRAVFSKGDDGCLKEIYYTHAKSGKWTLVLTQFRPDYSTSDTSEVQLWNTGINDRRFLIQDMQVTAIRKLPGEQKVEVAFTKGKNTFSQKISLTGDDSFFHVEVNGLLAGAHPNLDYLLSAYTFNCNGAPAFVHTPGLKFDDARSGRGRDQIIGDRAFQSPAVVLQQGALFASLVPDLRAINEKKVLSYNARSEVLFKPNPVFVVPEPADRISMPTGIDLNINTRLSAHPIITYGLIDAKVGYHTRFVRDERDTQMIRKLYNGKIGYGFDLLVNALDTGDAGYQLASQHVWKYYGEPVFADSPHLAMPYVDYLKLVEKTVFTPQRDSNGKLYQIPGGVLDPPVEGYADHGSWIEWMGNGERIGGFRCAAPQYINVINNTAFWNQARDAVGMYYWARQLKDTFLLSKARMMVNFCLSAPRNDKGLFSTVYNAGTRKWGIGWSDPPNGKNVLFLDEVKSYEIAPICKTGAHLIDYYLRAEKDDRIVQYLTPFANWLLTAIDDKGIIPSYVQDDMRPSDILYNSAQPAAGMWFLAQMYNATKQERFLAGAKKIAGYIEREIIPTAKWMDMEQYVSCGQKPFSMVRDEWQGQWFRGTLCTGWAAEGFAALYDATGDKRWLSSGEKCLDYLSFSQVAWKPHFIYTANPFGGFGSDNSDDAAIMDQRQAEFVKAYIYYGLKLSRKDLLERGVAAAQAACVLINTSRHVLNGITPHPKFYPEGLAPENVDHEGISQWPMRTHALWGEGIAVFTGLSEIRRALGGVYIDLFHDIVVGTDGVKVVGDTMEPGNTRKIDIVSFLSPKYLSYPYTQEYTVNAVVLGDKNLLLNNKITTAGISSVQVKPVE